MDAQETFPDLIAPLVARGWPRALAKATVDPFFYAVGLRGGAIIHFESAELIDDEHTEWVSLRGCPENMRLELDHGHEMTFERGLEVRVADILWAADAPHGS
jgi:hypothetical protein